MFFFFEQFKPGVVCNVISGRNIGEQVVIHQIFEGILWCYDNRPVTFRTNRKGDRIVDFDPACVTSCYSAEQLEITNEIPVQKEGWGVRHYYNRMI